MRTILVIEGSADLREELTEILRMEGFRVVSASEGAEGIAMVLRERPDLVLCAVTLPALDGFGTLHALRADPRLAATPFLLLGAAKDDSHLQRAIDLEADGYLTRPLEIAALLAAIKTQLAVLA